MTKNHLSHKSLKPAKQESVIRENPFLIRGNPFFKPFPIRVNPFWIVLGIAILSLFAFPKLTHAANINFSLEAWLKPTTSIATKAILVKNNEIRLVTDASGYLVCQIHNGTAWQTAGNSGAAIELNKWSQAGCSYDGLNLKVYINGVLKGTTAMTADVQNTTNNFFAGYDSSGGGYGRFSGTMDSIAIYKDALTAQEFADHYSRGNLYKDENNNLKFEIGNLSLSYDVSSWTSGGWHMITALWNPDGINQVSGSSMLYGNLFVDGASAASSSTSFTSASSTPSTFYFAQDAQNNGQFGGTIYGLQLDENNWKAADITTAYNSGTGIAPVASGKTNFTLSTASSTDVVAWQHSGSLANDGNFEDGDAADWSGHDEGSELVTNGLDWTDSNSDGLADSWSPNATQTNSIVTGNGFDGNAQRALAGSAYTGFYGYSLTAGKTYKVSFKYRASKALTVSFGAVAGGVVQNFSINTSDAISSGVIQKTCAQTGQLFFYEQSSVSDDYLEIDEISLKEVHTTSAQGGYVKDEQNLVGGWNFETADDTADATDVTGNNDLTWNNISSADYVEGKFGSAIDFNGTDEYLSQKSDYLGKVGTVTMATVASGALFNDASQDFTPYVGASGVSKPYMLVATDTGGKVAWGYIGEEGTGETLSGSELIGNQSMADTNVDGVADSPWATNYNNGHSIVTGNGFSANAQRCESEGQSLSYTEIYQNVSVVNNVLYKISYKYRGDNAEMAALRVYWGGGTSSFLSTSMGTNTGDAITNTFYFTAATTGSIKIWFILGRNGTRWFEVGDVSIQQVTALPANTGVKIYSTKTGSTQSWANVESGFLPNSIASYEVRKSDFQITGAMTLGAWVKPNGADEIGYVITKFNNSNYGFGVCWQNAPDTINFFYDGVDQLKSSSAVFTDNNQWVFITVIKDASGNVAFYRNGVAAGTASGATVSDSSNEFRIAARAGAQGTFNGLIDSPFIYSSALGGDEIRAMYERGYSDHYGAKIRLSADDAQSYINSNASLSNGGNYLLSFDYRLGEENINPINFTIRDGSGENTAEKNLMASSTTGLVGAWNFEETSSPAVDISGNGNNGTWGGNATYSTSGRFRNAVSFDGDSDYVAMPTINAGEDFTVELWAYINSFSKLYPQFIGKENYFSMGTNDVDQDLRVLMGNGSSWDNPWVDSESTLAIGQWHHLLFTHTGAAVNVYLNGVIEASEDRSDRSFNTDFYVGWRQGQTNTYSFNGLIDSVRIYNRALSPEEVYESYKKGLWHKYELSFEADEAATHLFRFIQNGSTSGDSILYVDNFDLQTNLVDNGGMEGTYTDGIPAGWSNSGLEAGEGAEETTTYRTGAKAFKLNSADADEGITETITVANGSWYTFSGWAKNNNQDLKVVLSGAIEDTIDLTTSNNNWTKFNKSYKSNSTNLTIAILSGAADQTGYFDDISVVALGSNSATVAASTAAFTPAFGYRPGKVSGENALPITLSDDLRFDEGGQMGTGSAELAYENFDPFGGTIKTWVKPHWDGTSTDTHGLLTDWDTDHGFKLYYSSGNLYFDVVDSDSTTHRVYQDVSSWTAGTWYHITATWSNQNTVNADATGYISNLYINGSDSGNTYSNVTAGTNFWTAFAPGTIYIGESSTPNNRWSGLISGLQVLNYPWSESSVSSDYNSGSGTLSSADANTIFYLPANSADADGMVRWHLKNYREVTTNESGLVAGYNFESAATDVTGIYTGTWYGSAAYSAGKNGNAADFDGSTDYVDLGDVGF